MPSSAFPIRRLVLAAAVLLAAGPAHAGMSGPATLVLQDVPTRLALVAIAQLEDLDVVTSSTLQDARANLVATLPLRAAFDRIAHEAGADVQIQAGGIRVVARPCAFARALAPVHVHVPGDWRRADFRLPGVERGSLLDILADYAQGPKRATPGALPPAVVGVRVRQAETRQLLWALQVAEGLEPASAARGPFDLRASTSASCPGSAPQPQAAAVYREDRPFAAYRLDELRMAGYLQHGDAIPVALVLKPDDHLSTLHVGDVLTADGAKVGAIYGDGVHLRAADGSAIDPPALPFHAPGVALQPPLAAVRTDAERGDARAQALLGQMLVRGNGTPRDIQAGARWVERAAEQGDAPAQSALGDDYDLGLGVDKDPARALAWHRRAAAQGVLASEIDLGIALTYGADRDVAAGLDWLARAAEHGDPPAEWYVGAALLDAAPPLHDAVRGIAWLRRAAEDGEVEAQVRLALELEVGLQVARDEPQAIEWYRRAVSRGSVSGALGLGGLIFQHAPNRDDDLRAVDMFMHGAKLDARSQYALGVMALTGRGGPVDKAAALRWFTASATQGLPAARDSLATLLLADDPERGAPLALPWLRAAALDTPGTQTPEQRERWSVPRHPLGYGPSQRTLGELLGAGLAGPIDVVQSWQWLTIADANGEPKARRELALLRPRMTEGQVAEGMRRAAAWIAERTPAGK